MNDNRMIEKFYRLSAPFSVTNHRMSMKRQSYFFYEFQCREWGERVKWKRVKIVFIVDCRWAVSVSMFICWRRKVSNASSSNVKSEKAVITQTPMIMCDNRMVHLPILASTEYGFNDPRKKNSKAQSVIGFGSARLQSLRNNFDPVFPGIRIPVSIQLEEHFQTVSFPPIGIVSQQKFEKKRCNKLGHWQRRTGLA